MVVLILSIFNNCFSASEDDLTTNLESYTYHAMVSSGHSIPTRVLDSNEALVKDGSTIKSGDILRIPGVEKLSNPSNATTWQDEKFMKIAHDISSDGSIKEWESSFTKVFVNDSKDPVWVSIPYLINIGAVSIWEKVKIKDKCPIPLRTMSGDSRSVIDYPDGREFFTNLGFLTVEQSISIAGKIYFPVKLNEFENDMYYVNLEELEEAGCTDSNVFLKRVDFYDPICLRDALGNKIGNAASKKFINNISTIIATVMDKSDRKVTSRSYPGIVNNFENTCCNSKAWKNYPKNFKPGECFEKFKDVLKQICDKNNVPVDIMLGIAVQESEGKCNAGLPDNYYSDDCKEDCLQDRYYGLFQCGYAECKDVVAGKEAADPEKLARKAVAVFANKYVEANKITFVNGERIVDRSVKLQGPVKLWNEMTTTEKSNWSRAIIGYNAGQGNLWKVSKILDEYNINGANLDKDNIDDIIIATMLAGIHGRMGKIKANTAADYLDGVTRYITEWGIL